MGVFSKFFGATPQRPPPLSDADNLDVAGIRQTGGVDLVIACSGPLDESDQTIELLSQKVRNYLQLALNPNLFTHFKAENGPVRVFVSCEFAVSARAGKTLDSLREELASHAVELRLVKSMEGI
jgi:predicted Zn-dependent peptidase